MTPEQLRISYLSETASNSAVSEFRTFLTTGKSAEDTFYAWLALPMTQLIVRALEELADNPPVSQQQDIVAQYGVTSGLQLAAKLMTQPKRVFPEVFQDAREQGGPLDKAYTTNADAAIDSL